MTWGVKYRTEFSDILELDCKVDIEEQDFPAIFNLRDIGSFTLYDCTLISTTDNYPRMTQTASTSGIYKDITTIAGADYPTCYVRYRYISGTAQVLQIRFETAGHGFSSSYREVFLPETDGEWHIRELDMTTLSYGGTDWVDNDILAIEIYFGSSSTNMKMDIDYVAF